MSLTTAAQRATPVLARFTERMVGGVTAVTGAEPVDVPGRADAVGDDIVAQARAAGLGVPAPSRVLDLDGLQLRVGVVPDGRDGYRSTVARGSARGLPGFSARPVLAGFADLLPRGGPGDRRMYYRLVVGPVDGPLLVEGVKVIRGSRLRVWQQTTTLYTRVSTLASEHDIETVVARPDRPLVGVVPVAAGVLRIRPADLVRQVLSMRGRIPRFLVGFAWRLAVR